MDGTAVSGNLNRANVQQGGGCRGSNGSNGLSGLRRASVKRENRVTGR